MMDPDGEAPTARAATAAGSIFVLSTFSVTPVEQVVEAATEGSGFLEVLATALTGLGELLPPGSVPDPVREFLQTWLPSSLASVGRRIVDPFIG
jgi:hypothetical protein